LCSFADKFSQPKATTGKIDEMKVMTLLSSSFLICLLQNRN
jgi:hypothetical protein